VDEREGDEANGRGRLPPLSESETEIGLSGEPYSGGMLDFTFLGLLFLTSFLSHNPSVA